MKRPLAPVLILFVVAAFAQAQISAAQLESNLRTQYLNKFVALRTPGFESELKFDDTGAAIAPLTPAPLANGGVFHVEQVRVKKMGIELHGHRVVMSGMAPVLLRDTLTVIVVSRAPFLSETAADAALQHIVLSDSEFQKSFQNYFVPSGSSVAPGAVAGTLAGNRPVYKVGGDVLPPRVVKTVLPEYSDTASAANFEGMVVLFVVVDESGVPELLKVARSIGMGLDEQAIAAVSHWRLDPATRGGVPVAVQVNVEVNFRLRDR